VWRWNCSVVRFLRVTVCTVARFLFICDFTVLDLQPYHGSNWNFNKLLEIGKIIAKTDENGAKRTRLQGHTGEQSNMWIIHQKLQWFRHRIFNLNCTTNSWRSKNAATPAAMWNCWRSPAAGDCSLRGIPTSQNWKVI